MSSSPVADIIRGRKATGSRADGHRLFLVVEGGGSRGVYSSGMVQAMEELGLSGLFDAIYGTSAGAINGAWLLSGRAVPGMRSWSNPEIMSAVINPARMLRGGAAFDVRYLVHRVYDGVEPMDFDAILGHSTTLHPIATDGRTGHPVDLRPHITDKRSLMRALRASANLPILAGGPLMLDGVPYFDGGIAEPIPIRSAVRAGGTHFLVLRTRRADEKRVPNSRVHQVVGGSYLRFVAPGAYRAFLARPALEEAESRAFAELGDAVLQIHPPAGSPAVDSTARDTDLLARALEIGRRAVYSVFAPQDARPRPENQEPVV
ncbi:patatin-like phospholipase family protein [Nocardia shimofusensis]|uniref:patatin-like phospholipase family protein n=1 Tax=Nocardia shimofusensis TaxID=228596 RepID=UPI001FE14C39|nr:patatin family protein [Nocardia shimofusensis]